MKFRNFPSLLIVLLFIFILPSVAREKERAKEILRYFPQGTYRMITHENLEQMAGAEIYPFYKRQMSRGSKKSGRQKPVIPLGGVFADKAWSLTSAELLKYTKREITLSYPEKPDEFRLLNEELMNKYPNLSFMSSRKSDDEENTFIAEAYLDVSSLMWVLRYDDAGRLIKQAVDKGELRKTDDTISGRPVYRIKGWDLRWQEIEYLVFLARGGDLLLAGSLEHLKKMVQTTAGKLPNMLEDPENVDLIDIIHELGQTWYLTFTKAVFQKQQETWPKAQITEKHEKELENFKSTLPVFTIRSTELGSEVISRQIRIFESEDAAKVFMEKGLNRPARSMNLSEDVMAKRESLDLVREKNSTLKRKGSWIVMTTIKDNEYYEAAYELARAVTEQEKEK